MDKIRELLDVIIKNANDIFILLDEERNIIDVNEAAIKMYGYPREEFLKLKAEDLRIPENKAELSKIMNRLKTEKRVFISTIHVKKSGEFFPVEIGNTYVTIGSKKFIHSIIRDVSERENYEKNLLKLNRVYAVLSNVNQLIVRGKDKQKIIDGACSIAVNYGHYQTVWISLIDSATQKVKYFSCYGSDAGHTKILLDTLNDIEQYIGPSGVCFREGKQILSNDLEKDYNKLVRAGNVFQNNICSAAYFPIKIKNKTVGIFTLYADEKNLFNNEEVNLLEEMVSDISYAIESIENEEIRRETEEALRLSEERMRVIVEGTPYLFFYAQDTEGNLIYVSPTVEQITGYSVEQWLKRRDWFITDSEINKYARQVTQTHLNGLCTNKIVNLEIYHKEGHKLILEAYENPIFKEGRVLGIHGVVHDITERKYAEEALKESEQRFRSLYENSIIGFYRTTPDGKILMTNPAILEMLGYKTFYEMSERNLEDEGYEPTYERSLFIDKIEKDGVVVGFESVWIRKDGTPIYVRENAKAIRDDSGKTLYYDGLVENVTERKRAEDEIRKLNSATEHSPVSIIITNTSGSIEYVNPRFTEITGYTLEEIKGQNPRILQSGNKSIEDYKEIWKKILSGEHWHGEFYNKKKDGTYFWASVSIASIKDEKGKITNFVGVEEDITDKKRILEELVIAKEKAEEMNRLKTNFLANMSHELRTPLIGILGFSDILTEELKEPGYKEMVQSINKGGNRLLKTLNLILDLSRIESNKLEIKMKDLELNNYVNETIKLFEGAAQKKGLYLKVIEIKTGIYIRADEDLLSQILNNIINNGIKYTKKGGVTLQLNEEFHDNKSWATIKIIDTGIGIPESAQEIIFDEFRQVSEGLNRAFEGTGLGLTIARKSVELLKGIMSVESVEGKGSTFIIRLPLNSTHLK